MNRNKKFLQNLSIILAFILASTQSLKAQNEEGTGFPYFVAFTQGLQPHEAYKPIPPGGNSNSATFTTNGLRLTQASRYQFGSVILADQVFPSDKGIQFEFEYAIYGGSGADGISIFLMDGDLPKNQINIGANGSGLGYAFNNSLEGLRGAYLGIGLDEYTNSKQARENRNGLFGVNIDNNARQFVILRGARGNQNLGNDGGVGYNGYPLLYAVGTNYAPSTTNRGAVLNSSTGRYTAFSSPNLKQFRIDSGGANYLPQDDTDSNYRKAYVKLVPNTSLGGYSVTLRIQHGSTIETVIDNYHYETSYKYINSSRNSSKVLTLNTAPPRNFRIGFAASTGQETNIHILKNLGVTRPYSAEAMDDSYRTCPNKSVRFSPLDNDVAYTGSVANGSPPATASKDNIDPNSFRFVKPTTESNANSTTQVLAQSPNFTYTDENGNTWAYDKTTENVLFTPAVGYTGIAQIYYDIKGGGRNGTDAPYNKEEYRSMPALIQVNVSKTADCYKSCVISNKNVTAKILR